MTNIDKAADLLYQRSKELLGAGSDAAHRACQEHAQALADAGLLAPELPALSSDYASIEVPTRRTLIMNDDDCPILYENEDSILVGTVNGEVNFSLGVHDEISVTLPADKARNLAHALLAAANNQEKA